MPQISLEEELRAAIGLELGDEITYAIGGESLTVRLTSTRVVQWESFRPNFFMVLSPGAIEAVRAHLHHELVCRARSAPRDDRSRAAVPERVGVRHRRRARSGASIDGPRRVGRAVRLPVHARGRRHGAARGDSVDARRAHVRERRPAHARRTAQRRAARSRGGVHRARVVGWNARGRRGGARSVI